MFEQPSSARGLRSTRETLKGELYHSCAFVCQTTAVRFQPWEAVRPAHVPNWLWAQAVREDRSREGVAWRCHQDQVVVALGDVLEEDFGNAVVQEVVRVAAPHRVDLFDVERWWLDRQQRVFLQQRLLEGVSHVRSPLDPGEEVQDP